MAAPKQRLHWIFASLSAIVLLILVGCLPLVRCPVCSGWCRVEAYINGEKIPCDLCGARSRVAPITKVWYEVGRALR